MAPKRKAGPKSKTLENVTVRKPQTTKETESAGLMKEDEEVESPNNGDKINGNVVENGVEDFIPGFPDGSVTVISDEDNENDENFLPKKKNTKSKNEHKIKQIRKRAASVDPISTNEIVILKSDEHVDIKKIKNKIAVTNEEKHILKSTKTNKKTTKMVENSEDVDVEIEIVQEEQPQQEEPINTNEIEILKSDEHVDVKKKKKKMAVTNEEKPTQNLKSTKTNKKTTKIVDSSEDIDVDIEIVQDEQPQQEELKNKREAKQESVEPVVPSRTKEGVKAKQVEKPKAASSKPKKHLKSGPKSKQVKSSDDSSGNYDLSNDMSDSEMNELKQVDSEQANVSEKPKRRRRVKDKELNENDLMKSPPSPFANDGEGIKTGNLPDDLPDNPESGKHDIKQTAVKRKTKAKPAKK